MSILELFQAKRKVAKLNESIAELERDAKPLKNLFLTVRLNMKPKSTW